MSHRQEAECEQLQRARQRCMQLERVDPAATPGLCKAETKSPSKALQSRMAAPSGKPAGQDRAHESSSIVTEASLLLSSCREQGNLCRGRTQPQICNQQGMPCG